MNKTKGLLLLAVIYLSFISLGLPDGMLGIAWPTMRLELGQPLESMGAIAMALMIMSGLSCIFSERILRRLGTAAVTCLSCALTGLALLGYSLAPGFGWIIALTLPLGLGQGAVDTGLNKYVADHYSARHMNWLHCFWGIGASLGPAIMTRMILQSDWRAGYRSISIVQLSLAALLLLSILGKIWMNGEAGDAGEGDDVIVTAGLSGRGAQIAAVATFALYSGVEFSCGYWLNSVLVESRNIAVSAAGAAISVFYGGIMAGRLLTGFIVNRFGNAFMIRLGFILALAGILIITISHAAVGVIGGALLAGLGLGPIFPCIIHETPRRFDRKTSDRLIGYQLGATYLSAAFFSTATGFVLARLSLEGLFPIMLVSLAVTFLINEWLQGKARAILRRN